MSSSVMSSKMDLCTTAQVSILRLLERHRCSVFICVVNEYLKCLEGEFDPPLLLMVAKSCDDFLLQTHAVESFMNDLVRLSCTDMVDIQGVSGGIVNIIGAGSMNYSE